MENGYSEKTTPLSKDPAGIPRRMQQARIDRGLTLSQLSKLSGASAMAISNIENGEPGYSLHDLNRTRKVLGISLSYVMDGEEGLKKAYSHNGEDWEYDWDTFLYVLMDHIGVGDTRGLIGAEYFEGDQVPVTTDGLVSIDMVIEVIHDNAREIMGEYAEDYPNLTNEEEAELKGIIVSFLDKKDPRGYFKVENVVTKTITAEDMEETK